MSNLWTILQGDALTTLKTLPSDSVHCVVTSPPYWGLRDYGANGQIGLEPRPDCVGWATGERCNECYICRMTAVFSEVLRVMRPDGTCWLNIGDTYSAGSNSPSLKHVSENVGMIRNHTNNGGVREKNLLMIPARLALSLQSIGYYLRSEIIWHKTSAMPESVKDRPSKAHEMIYLLTKSPRYFYDSEAVKESSGNAGKVVTLGEKSFSAGQARGAGVEPSGNGLSDTYTVPNSRNLRSVWSFSGANFPQAHFATFPTELPMRCIKAGTSERGCCPECGAPIERTTKQLETVGSPAHNGKGNGELATGTRFGDSQVLCLGWQPLCTCNAGDPIPCTVLDPFAGAGTTLLVATRLGRQSIGIELNPTYAQMAADRIIADSGIAPEAVEKPLNAQLRMFE